MRAPMCLRWVGALRKGAPEVRKRGLPNIRWGMGAKGPESDDAPCLWRWVWLRSYFRRFRADLAELGQIGSQNPESVPATASDRANRAPLLRCAMSEIAQTDTYLRPPVRSFLGGACLPW